MENMKNEFYDLVGKLTNEELSNVITLMQCFTKPEEPTQEALDRLSVSLYMMPKELKDMIRKQLPDDERIRQSLVF